MILYIKFILYIALILNYGMYLTIIIDSDNEILETKKDYIIFLIPFYTLIWAGIMIAKSIYDGIKEN